MRKIIKNEWVREGAAAYARARILTRESCPEGLDVERVRFLERGELEVSPEAGHLISVVRGGGVLRSEEELRIEAGVHLYVPPGEPHGLELAADTELVMVSSPAARGTSLLLRDETFLAACAVDGHALRWVLTPQYLSRRIFLHHDPILLSRSNEPVSWFRTTMFDVSGLPPSEDGDAVFKMSYNSRTEFNVCYEVEGIGRVRMAQHPYRDRGQRWDPWVTLDADTTYHLDEAAGGPDEERAVDPITGVERRLRNKHEVSIDGGHVSLFCLFDPAPTGVERHRPGEYSDYEPLAEVVVRKEYETHRRELARFDEMVETLSRAKARGELDALRGSSTWALYEEGHRAQCRLEAELKKTLLDGRDRVIERWMQSPPR